MLNCNRLSYTEAMELHYIAYGQFAFKIIITKDYGIFENICKN